MGCIKLLRVECALRIISLLCAVLSALIIGLDSQTKTVFYIAKKAYFKDLPALWVMLIVISVAAGYQFLQLMRAMASAWLGRSCSGYDHSSKNHRSKFVAALNLLLDQGLTYAAFAAMMAAIQGSVIAVFGVPALQWSKLCNVYTRFCARAAVGVVLGLLSSLAMAALAAISAHRLFKLCPPQRRRSAPKPDVGTPQRWLLF